MVRVPVSRRFSRGFRCLRVCRLRCACPCSSPASRGPRVVRPSPALVHGFPSKVCRRSRRFPRRRSASRKGCCSSPVSGFFQALVSGFFARPKGRLRGRASPHGHLQKRLTAGHDEGICLPSSAGSGKVPVAFARVSARSSACPAIRSGLLRRHDVLPSRSCLPRTAGTLRDGLARDASALAAGALPFLALRKVALTGRGSILIDASGSV